MPLEGTGNTEEEQEGMLDMSDFLTNMPGASVQPADGVDSKVGQQAGQQVGQEVGQA